MGKRDLTSRASQADLPQAARPAFELKERKLKKLLRGLGGAAVAFSGGVDSTYLAAVCAETLPGRCVVVTGRSASFPAREREAAEATARQLNLRHILIDSEELDIPEFSSNPPNRCYLCKRELFAKIKLAAAQAGLPHVVEASNVDDEVDFRPGLQALAELGILSPLRQANLTKDDIRQLSKARGLATWDKPSFACLASRFPYGERITPERLGKVDLAETFLLSLGLRQVRVRFHDHGDLARIETDDEGLALLTTPAVRPLVAKRFLELGFTYTAADLAGYRTGSMNASLTAVERKASSPGPPQLSVAFRGRPI
ncbi:MAG: ATP-dependent sacrificial sulfur transferase LarE [Deltaproteobacteria bacterium]|jgi:uncharacterized protein|nr:ATP-dependent sacrificial sulfur transferase LarE [Deltaproteobacteria bacterium]